MYNSVVCLVRQKGKYLLVKREDNGLWVLPGGRVEGGESVFNAAKRELFEETGISCKDLKLLASWFLRIGWYSFPEIALIECLNIKGELRSSWETPEVRYMDSAEVKIRAPLYIQELLDAVENNKKFFALYYNGRYEFWVICSYLYGKLKRKFRDLIIR